MWITALFLIGGFAAAGSGIYWLHKINSQNSLFERVSAVFYTMLGCFGIWAGIANVVPPVIDEKLKVEKIGERWAMAKLTFNPIRNCKADSFKTILIFGNNRLEVPALMIAQGDTKDKNTTVRFVYLGFLDPVDPYPDSFYVQSTHVCTMGFTFTTDSPIIPIDAMKGDATPGVPPVRL